MDTKVVIGPKGHAKKSPSGASGWMNCSGWRSDPTGSVYADWGTDAHEFAALCLVTGNDAEHYRGQFGEKGNPLDDDMIDCVQTYIDFVRAIPGELHVEQSVPIDHLTGEEGATGTSDAIILDRRVITVVDLKGGMGVRVDAEGNEQMMMYALGALEKFGLVRDFDEARMIIVQPRIDHISEHTITVDDLVTFGLKVTNAAKRDPNSPLNPGTDTCRWCAAKATCPALEEQVMDAFEDETVVQDVAQLDKARLGALMGKVDMIESWCKAIRAQTETTLVQGNEVPGYKLVQGKRGNRKWVSEEQALAAFKSMRIKHDLMYDLKLISPTKAEKVLAESPKRWARLESLITQSEGALSVAPVSDKRPAIRLDNVTDDFE